MEKTKPVQKNGQNLSILYAAILVATVLRLYRLDWQSVWGDEALTVLHYTAGSSMGEAWQRIWTSGGHPPLYFLTVFHWFKLGQSEFMLRFPSLVFGVASVPLMYALVNRLYGHQLAGISAFVIALSPIHIWYSQEARMYALQILLLLASTFFLLRAAREPRPRHYVLFASFSVMALYTHMASALFIAGQALFILLTQVRSRRALAVWIGYFLVIGIAFVPWLTAFVADNAADGGSIAVGYASRQSSILDAVYAFYTFSVGYSFGPSVEELHELDARRVLSTYWPSIVISALTFGILALLGLRRAVKSSRTAFVLIFTLLGVPALLAVAGSMLPGFPLNPRYILPAVIPYWILLALGLQSCLHRQIRSIAAMVVLITGISLCGHYVSPRYMKQDMRSAVGVVNRQAHEGDVVIISSIELGGPFLYYWKRHNVPYFGYPPTPGVVDRARLDRDLEDVAARKNRVWLILGRMWSSDPDGLIVRHFDRLSSPALRHRYPGITLLRYDIARPHDD